MSPRLGLGTALAWLACATALQAQIDDMLDGPWARPAVDVIERRREDPICLRCADAHALTEIPGIASVTAGRIVRMVNAGAVRSIEHLADTLCLSTEQFLLLTACTTLECSCTGLIRAADARTRWSFEGTLAGHVRVDLSHHAGRAGAIVSHGPAGPAVLGLWGTASLGDVDVAVGDVGARIGGGLSIGTGIGLMRGVAGLLTGPAGLWRLRPWMSSDRTDAIRGAFVHTTSHTAPFGLLAGYGLRTTTDGTERVGTAVISGGSPSLRMGVGIISTTPTVELAVAARSFLVTLRSDLPQGAGMADVGVDADGRVSAHIMGEWTHGRTDVGGAAWWYHPSGSGSLGTGVPGTSAPTNNAGIALVLRNRLAPSLTLTSSIRYGGALTRTARIELPLPSAQCALEVQARSRTSTSVIARMMYERTMQRGADVGVRVDAETPLAPGLVGRLRCDLRRTVFSTNPYAPDRSGTLVALGLRYGVNAVLSVRGVCMVYRADTLDVAPRMLTPSVQGDVVPLIALGAGWRNAMVIRWQTTEVIAVSAAAYDDRRVRHGVRTHTYGVSVQCDLRLRPRGGRGSIAFNDEARTGLE